MKFKSIASRLIVSVLPIIAAFTLIFILLTYFVSKRQMDGAVNDKMQESLSLADAEISGVLSESARVSRDLAIFASASGEQRAETGDDFENRKASSARFLESMISSCKNVMGGGIWFQKNTMPVSFGGVKTEFYSHYVYGDGAGWHYVDDYSDGGTNNFHSDEWFVEPQNRGAHWTNVYYDPVACIDMITVTYAFYCDEGNFLGVTTADMSLDAIRSITSSLKIGATGSAFLLGADGEYISFFEPGKSLDDKMQDDGDENLSKAGKYLSEHKEGQLTLKRGKVNKRVYFKTVAGTDWILAVAINESEISSTALNSILILIIVPVAGLALSAVSILFMARRLKRVTAKVNNFAETAAGGDFSRRIQVTETDEFGTMEQRLNMMIANMQAMSDHSAKMLELAQAASHSKSDFLSRMSHEIRTPMNAVIGMTQIAQKSSDPAKIAECLNKIDSASRHLLSLINDILDMSKIEANKLELTFAEFSLEKTLSNIYNFIAVRIEEKHQKFTLTADKAVPPCLIGDELRFSQVITNLLSNAVKFTPAGGEIGLEIKQVSKDDKYVNLSVAVSDNGIGMNAAQLERLFRPFEQADSGTSRKYGGTGLGLAICKSIVELAGGEISAESRSGKGSRFTFTMRFLIGAEKESRSGAYDLSKLKVMAVDDNADTVEYLKNLMSGSDIRCEGARSGLDALEKIRQAIAANSPFDIVFLDYVMPGMDGLEAARAIRALSSSTLIIMISAHDLTSVKRDFVNLGVEKFLLKPFSPSDIFNIISSTAGGMEKCRVDTAAKTENSDFSKYRLLLCEDVEINREIVAALLEGTGVNIDYAENGSIGVEKFKSGRKYDLILMDLQMPEMDGLTATELIRQIDKDIPILAMTANAFKDDIDQCINAGMNGHIAKPLDYEVLIENLRKYLK